ncbi:integrase DNA-binding domain-containing protein [Ruminococcus flavefaciens]|uniref:integrase DNA-binding domain-containing protein n=1 Tax=Ruminococcus flavefaciens TaxID=1265 RepID=UPI00350E37F5
MGIRGNIRRDPKRRILRAGESIRADGKYQFKYYVDGKPHFVYSWKLEPTDTLPQGKKPCLSLREMEKQIGYDLDAMLDPQKKNMTVMELVERYLRTRTAVKPQTKTNYNFVVNLLKRRNSAAERSEPSRPRMQSCSLSRCRVTAEATVPSRLCAVCCDRHFRWRSMMTFSSRTPSASSLPVW